MKKMMRTAFSLIELSIVILIIGIIIAGVTQSSILVKKFRLSTARTLTNSAPMASMNDVIMWVEATSEESFIDIEEENGNTLSIWYDINPTKNTKNNPAQSDATYKPIYKENCINSLPCVNFSDAKYFDFDGTQIVGTGYSIFIVERRLSGASGNYFIGSEGNDYNSALILGYGDNNTLTFAQYANDFSYGSIASYSTPIARIHAFISKKGVSKKYYLNGAEKTLTVGGGADQTVALVANPNAHIGRALIWSSGGSSYTGDIAEIIIFANSVSHQERTDIESYLSKKWGVKLD